MRYGGIFDAGLTTIIICCNGLITQWEQLRLMLPPCLNKGPLVSYQHNWEFPTQLGSTALSSESNWEDR